MLAGCGGGGANSGGGNRQQSPTITSVNASCSPASILTTQTSTCIPTVSGTGSYSSTVTWSVSPSSIGGVSSAGIFTPSGPGTATITATSTQDTTKSGSATVNVTAASTITSVSVSCSPTSITTAQTATCSSTVTGTGSFSTAVTWSVSPSSIGNVSSAGVFTPSGTGTAAISATSTQDSTKAGQATVNVAAVNPPAVTLSASPSTINFGQSATLAWTSTNAASVTIDNGVGNASPVTGGSTTVSPTASTTYTITATGATGTTPATAQATVTVIPSTTVTTTSVVADGNGIATFSSAGVQVQVLDLVSQQSMAGAGVTLLQQGGTPSGLIAVNPNGKYFPSISLLGMTTNANAARRSRALIGKLTTTNVQSSTGPTAVWLTNTNYLTNSGSTIPVALTGSMWDSLGTSFATCKTGSLSDLQNVLSDGAEEEALQFGLEDQADADVIAILNVTAPEAAAPVDALILASNIGTLVGEAEGEGLLLAFEAEGYQPTDQFNVCYANGLVGQTFLDHMLFKIEPVGPPSGTPLFATSVKGNIYDSATGVAIANSTVMLAGPTSQTVLSDSSGNFTFNKPIAWPTGSYTLSALDPGYVPGSLQFPLSPSQAYVANIGLSKPPDNPVPAISQLTPNVLLVGSGQQVITVEGSHFIAESTVTYNGVLHPSTFVDSTQISFTVSSSDLAMAGSFPVVVSNPTPGGGPSNSLNLAVSSSGVVISPVSVYVPVGGVQTFTAAAAGAGGITWSIQEGAGGGAITTGGIYTAPTVAGIFHVVATSSAIPSQSATSTVNVVAGPAITTIHSFDHTKEGANPAAPLISTTGGVLYGTTEAGGNLSCAYISTLHGCGTIFQTDTSGNVSTLHTFSGQDGAYPVAALLAATNGLLYGTTLYGGTYYSSCEVGGTTTLAGCGTIFTYSSAGTFTSAYSFGPFTSSVGVGPEAPLIQVTNGTLYGTASTGDATSCSGTLGSITHAGCGAIFQMAGTSAPVSLHSFLGNEGIYPEAALLSINGNLFGSTAGGGDLACSSYASPGCGTLFGISSSGATNALHSFTGLDGADPNAPLILGADGSTYGTTSFGGNTSCGEGGPYQGCGTVFKIDPSGNFIPLHSFSGVDGAYPNDLLQASDGYFYGTTYGGGDTSCAGKYGPGCGTVFRMDPAGNVTVLYEFTGASDGSWPGAGVIQGSDGNLYGTTLYGGVNDDGVIFRISNLTALTAAKTQSEVRGVSRDLIVPLSLRQPHVGRPGPPGAAQH